MGATPTIRVSVVIFSEMDMSGYILQPPQPLPHLQADPQPQFPPQHDDIFREKIRTEFEKKMERLKTGDNT
ncbi:hypothetical protein, partial [Acinetobacter baumannii]|uniref:hypothetical protein n=1 Tax=Acinetobacter baumannii TaxID=470 RepID=UPI001D0D58A7